MNPEYSLAVSRRLRLVGVLLSWLIATEAGAAAAEPVVEFDFARVAEYRVVAPDDATVLYPDEQLIEVVLPISVRFRGSNADAVESLDIEIDASEAGLRVSGFSPTTQLASEMVQAIETTTTTQRVRSIDATLGGEVPVPYAELAAHVAPSISAAASNNNVATERVRRLPPKEAIVVSGTALRGQGVFFKLKRSSQTSLEGVHQLAVTLVVPVDWRGDALRVTCTARGTRKTFWSEQPAVFGQVASPVELYLAGDARMRELAERRAERTRQQRRRRPSLIEATATELQDAAKSALGELKS